MIDGLLILALVVALVSWDIWRMVVREAKYRSSRWRAFGFLMGLPQPSTPPPRVHSRVRGMYGGGGAGGNGVCGVYYAGGGGGGSYGSTGGTSA